jgi:hypothetical protein
MFSIAYDPPNSRACHKLSQNKFKGSVGVCLNTHQREDCSIIPPR